MSDELKACPNLGCNNAGWYPEAHEDIHNVGDWDSEVAWEQVQCEFCYTEPNSVFNVVNALRADKEHAEAMAASLQDENYELSNAHARAYHVEEKQHIAESMVERLIEVGKYISSPDGGVSLGALDCFNALVAEWKEGEK